MHPTRTAGLGAAVLALTAPLTAAQPAEAAPATAPPEASAQANGYAGQAFEATNRQRAARDLTRLERQRCLQRKAARQAERMASRGEIFHQDLQPVLEDCDLTTTGENVASGFPTGAATVNRGWMHSEGHRANILEADYRLMGLAARKHHGRWYVAQVFGAR